MKTKLEMNEKSRIKVFISHSHYDEGIVCILSDFLESINEHIDVFCSSRCNSIINGKDFVKVINDQIDECDYFIAITSVNYKHSRYSFIELGCAYSRMIHKKRDLLKLYTLPGGEDVLEKTPLQQIQSEPLCDIDSIKGLIKVLKDKGISIKITNNEIREFINKINEQIIIQNDLFQSTDIIACCSDPNLQNAIKYTNSGNNIAVMFQLGSKNKKNWPDFISLVLNFYNSLDLWKYYSANNNICLHFRINNYSNSLQKIQIEFQTVDNKVFGIPYVIDLKPNETNVNIPISVFGKYKQGLSNVVNICFVVLKDYLTEKEGNFDIEELSFIKDC